MDIRASGWKRYLIVLYFVFCAPLLFPRPSHAESRYELEAVSLRGRSGTLSFHSFVYVPVAAHDAFILDAISRQVKSLVGSLKDEQRAPFHADPTAFIDQRRWTREILNVYPSAGQNRQILRVGYRYQVPVLVDRDRLPPSSSPLVLLAGDYTSYFQQLSELCTKSPFIPLEKIWYYFSPQQESCQAQLKKERREIAASYEMSVQPGFVTQAEIERWFIVVTAEFVLDHEGAEERYPEYDRLFGLDDEKTSLVVYAFTGADISSDFGNDAMGLEHVKFLKRLSETYSALSVRAVIPGENLLEYTVEGTTISARNIQQVLSWILSAQDFPEELRALPEAMEKLRYAAFMKLSEHWIYLDLALVVAERRVDGSDREKKITLQIRAHFGTEDPRSPNRAGIKKRYLEAFTEGDVIIYNGHSYFGKGLQDPSLYQASDFNLRYQLMFFDSCSSLGYFHQGFFDLKREGTRNLDIISNALPSCIENGGEIMAQTIIGLLSTESYRHLLTRMQGLRGSDCPLEELRVVNGEEDNLYSPARSRVRVRVDSDKR